jgi:hypothetical protein
LDEGDMVSSDGALVRDDGAFDFFGEPLHFFDLAFFDDLERPAFPPALPEFRVENALDGEFLGSL